MRLPKDVAAEKNALRVQQRERLGQLGAEERAARSASLIDRLLASPIWQAAKRVCLFAPLPSEPDLDLLWAGHGLAGKEVAYTRVTQAKLQLWCVRGLADLQPGRWGLREPRPEGLARMSLEEIELVLVPGLAFDRQGGRLGKGGGFYDRLLSGKGSATRTVGIAFAFQIIAKVPLEPHDVALDEVITDQGSAAGGKQGSWIL